MSQIPPAQRLLVQGRDSLRCVRCLASCPTGHWHHRRGRAVRDRHTHEACNGIWLCVVCHTWVHANPLLARYAGLIVSRYVKDPSAVPVTTPHALRWLDCVGGFTTTALVD